METKEIKCKGCGAPLPYVSGESVLHCDYCGSTTMLASLDNIVKLEEHFIIPSTQSSASVVQHCRAWMKEGFFKAKDLPLRAVFGKIESLFLPFWVVHAQVITFWSGMNQRTRTVGSGKYAHTETYWEPASGSIQDELGWVVYARSNMNEYFGLTALNPGGTATVADWGGFALGMGLGNKTSEGIDLTTGKTLFQAELAKGMKIVNGQITQAQAEERARAQITAYHRRLVNKKVDQVTNCTTTIVVEKTELIYAPLWFVDYSYKGKNYRMLVEGHKGRIITGEAPVGKWDKVVVSGIVGGLVTIVSGLAGYYINAPWAPYLFFVTGASVLAVGIHALITALKPD